MELTNIQLPKGLSKTINDLARSREKSAKQKYLIDLAESLTMHLSAFLLAEYKECGSIHIELEKDLFKNNTNLSFGVYVRFLRKTASFLHTIGKDSKIHQLLLGKNDFPEIAKFTKAYAAIKEAIDNQKDVPLKEAADAKVKENAGKLNILDFFDKFVELRNRVAHPHKEVKGVNISWPFHEDYFDAINPYMEKALQSLIGSLSNVWEFKTFTVNDSDEKTLILESEDGEIQELNTDKNFEKGIKVVLNQEENLLLFEWTHLTKAGEEAIESIRKEEEQLRKNASIKDLKEAIKSALDDEQISNDEFQFFQSLGKTKLGLSKSDVKNIILEVAHSMGIEDPFPEVDKRFIEIVDQAIKTKTYNEFLLKLTGQQYGVDSEAMEKIFLERTFALNEDPEEIKRNRVLLFTPEEMNSFQGLVRAFHWISSINLFNSLSKGQFKISGNSYDFGTKEYWHRTSFLSVENFIKQRLSKLSVSEDVVWETNQNNWQIGAMTGYAWCTFYPKNNLTGRFLVLSFFIDKKAVRIGFSSDWKDHKFLKNYGLLMSVLVEHLKYFHKEFELDLKKYPNIKLMDSLNDYYNHSFTDTMEKHLWYYDYLFDFDNIHFMMPVKTVTENPYVMVENFDIAFNLFSGLFEKVFRDYKNLLDSEYLIDLKENEIRQKLMSLKPTLQKFGIWDTDKNQEKEQTKQDKEDKEDREDLGREQISNTNEEIRGSAKFGFLAKELRHTIKGYPLTYSIQIRQNHIQNKLNFLIYISCAGYLEPEIHQPAERVLESLLDYKFPETNVFFMRSKLLLQTTIEDIDIFDPKPLLDNFLYEFAERCAYNYTPFQNLTVPNVLILPYIEKTSHILNDLSEKLSSQFGNQIIKERNLIKGYRYIDYVYSVKKVIHWIGWGLEFRNNELYAGIIFQIKNSLLGAHLLDKIDTLVKQYDCWKTDHLNSDEAVEAVWFEDSIIEQKLSASSEWSRNFATKHCFINSNSYWCSKQKDDKQWIQIEFTETKEILKLRLQGADAQGKNFVRTFRISHSIDGKKWETLADMEGLENGHEIKEIDLGKGLRAKFFRINIISFELNPSLRFDLLTRQILPSKVEMKYVRKVNNQNDLEEIMAEIPERVKEFKSVFDGHTGF
jgi:hypothetical protein